MQKPGLSTFVILLLSACAVTGGRDQVRIANTIVFNLLTPASFGESVLLTQAATIGFGNEQRELLFYTEITPASISIVGTLPNGTRLFNINYDGQVVSSDGPRDLLSSITPEYFLADLQLSQWPLEQVESSLAAANPCFANGSCTLTETADHLQRNLTRDGSAVISIQYGAAEHYRDSTSYIHHERGYRLQVETLEVVTTGEQP
jgi:hypothetical protein